MAYAKKCDRCGALYEITDPKQIEIKGISVYGVSWMLSRNDTPIDFCPECLRKFKEWFEKEKNNDSK